MKELNELFIFLTWPPVVAQQTPFPSPCWLLGYLRLFRAWLGAIYSLPASFYQLLSCPTYQFLKVIGVKLIICEAKCPDQRGCRLWALGSGERRMLSMRLPEICAFAGGCVESVSRCLPWRWGWVLTYALASDDDLAILKPYLR